MPPGMPKFGGEKPAAGQQAEDIEQKLNALVGKADIKALVKLMEQSGQTPDWDVVQKGYNDYVQSGYLKYVRDLFDATGVPPEFSDDAVQARYAVLFAHGWGDAARELQELTKIPPKLERPGAEAFEKAIMRGQMKDLEKLIAGLGQPPAEIVRRGYAHLLQGGYIDSMARMFELTGVEPELDPEEVQKRYQVQFKNNWIDMAHKLHFLSRLDAEVDPKEFESKCDLLWKRKKYAEVVELMAITGQEPFTETRRRSFYSECVLTDLTLLDAIETRTGKHAGELLDVERVFDRLLKEGRTENLKTLAVGLPPDLLQRKLTALAVKKLDSKDFWAFKDLVINFDEFGANAFDSAAVWKAILSNFPGTFDEERAFLKRFGPPDSADINETVDRMIGQEDFDAAARLIYVVQQEFELNVRLPQVQVDEMFAWAADGRVDYLQQLLLSVEPKPSAGAVEAVAMSYLANHGEYAIARFLKFINGLTTIKLPDSFAQILTQRFKIFLEHLEYGRMSDTAKALAELGVDHQKIITAYFKKKAAENAYLVSDFIRFATNYGPPALDEGTANLLYKKCLQQGVYSQIDVLDTALGRKMPDELLKHEIWLLLGDGRTEARLAEIEKYLGQAKFQELVDPGTAKVVLDGIVRSGDVERFLEVRKLLGVDHRVDPKFIQDRFDALLEQGDHGLAEIEMLIDKYGVRPEFPPEKIEAAFYYAIESGAFHLLTVLVRITGERPVAAKYGDLLAEKLEDELKGAYQVDGGRLATLAENLRLFKGPFDAIAPQIQQCYEVAFGSYYFGAGVRAFMEAARSVEQATGIMIETAVISDLGRRMIGNRSWNELIQAREIFGDRIAVDPAVVTERLVADWENFSSEEIRVFEKVCLAFGLVPFRAPREALEKIYGHLWSQKKYDMLASLVCLTDTPFTKLDAAEIAKAYADGVDQQYDSLFLAYRGYRIRDNYEFEEKRLDELERIFEITRVPMVPIPKAVQRTDYWCSSVPSLAARYGEVMRKIWSPDHPFPERPWSEMFARLLKVQAQSENSAYDPWRTELDPLLESANQVGWIDYGKKEDAEIVYDFVREQGMINLPTMFRWYSALSRVKKPEDLSVAIKKQIENDLGLDLKKAADKGQIFQEMRKFRQKFQADLLSDRLPESVLKTELGAELFTVLRGRTEFEDRPGDAPIDGRSLARLWKQTLERKPALGELPSGYETAVFQVAVQGRGGKSSGRSALEAERKRSEARRAVLENTELGLLIDRGRENFAAAFRMAEDPTKELSAWWAGEKRQLADGFAKDIASLEARIASVANLKAKAGMEKQLASLREGAAKVAAFDAPKIGAAKASASDLMEFMEKVAAALDWKHPAYDRLLRQLSALHMALVMPDGFRAPLAADAVGRGRELTAEKVALWQNFLGDFVDEHYLNAAEGHAGAGVKLSPEMIKRLQLAWGVGTKIGENPIFAAHDKLRQIGSSGKGSLDKQLEISLVPAKGLLRMVSGSLGDACTIGRRDEFAKGEYPDITSFTFVTNLGTVKERLRGSVLAIEAKIPGTGQKALVIRANNPQANLLSMVDAKELIRKTLEEMRKLADRRGIKYVVVPLDVCRAASSQRKEVTNYYQENFRARPKLRLENVPDTNFNYHAVWNPDGNTPVVEIGGESAAYP